MPFYNFRRTKGRQGLIARLTMMSDAEQTKWCDERREDDWPCRLTGDDEHLHTDECRATLMRP